MARVPAGGGGLVEVTGSDNFFVNNTLDARGQVTNTLGDLILSGTRVTVSGALEISGTLTSPTHLILSSSAGSVVQVSGALSASNIVGTTIIDTPTEVKIRRAGSNRFTVGATAVSSTVTIQVPELRSTVGHLILSSSVGSVIYVSGTLRLPIRNAEATPELSFGDGATGFFNPSGGTIGVSCSGVQRFAFGANNQFVGDSGQAFACINATPSNTGPTLAPRKTDITTGIGSGQAGELALIAAGNPILQIEAGATILSGNLVMVSGSGDIFLGQGQSIFLDDDQDTFITANNNDDRLSFQTGGVERFRADNSFFSIFTSVTRLGSSESARTDVRGILNNDQNHLILSSSAGSQVVVSGSLRATEFVYLGPNTDVGFTFNGDSISLRAGASEVGRIALGGPFFFNNKKISLGSSLDASFVYSTLQAPDALVLGVGSDSNGFIICENNDTSINFSKALQDDPTIFLQSSDATSIEQFLKLNWQEVSAGGSHLILSSSGGSTVAVSGSLRVLGTATQFAEMALTASSIVDTNITADQWTQLTASYQEEKVVGDFVVDSTGSISYVGDVPLTVRVEAAASFRVGSANEDSVLAVALNGEPIEKSKIQRRTSQITDVGAIGLQATADMTQGDSVSIYGTIIGTTTTLTLERLNVLVQSA